MEFGIASTAREKWKAGTMNLLYISIVYTHPGWESSPDCGFASQTPLRIFPSLMCCGE